jgi:cytochrome P450
LPLAQGITLDVIVEAVFGERDPERVAELHSGIVGLVSAFNPLVATFAFLQRDFAGFGPWAKFERRATSVRKSIDRLIVEKRARPGQDILSLLLATRDEAGQPLDETEVYEQLLTFVVAGHETTATTLAWALYELHRHPTELARLRTEIASTPAANPDELARLPFLDAVISETLRCHPPVPIVPRRVAREFTLGSYTLPVGQSVGLAVYMSHSDPKNHANPRAFLPERFLGKPSAQQRFTYLPFGGGARRCLGAAFAAYELKVVLGTLLATATFTLDEKRPVGNAFRIGTFGPKTGVRMIREP